jgi:PAS domain S-box-containing protein
MENTTEENQVGKQLNLIEKAADTSNEGITVSDALQPDNPIIYANHGFVRLTGYSKDDVIGKNCRFLQGPHSDPNTVGVISQALETGKPCTVELLNYRKDGTPFWNRLSITPIFDNTGQITNFVGIQSDITELKHSKEKLEAANRELSRFKKEITLELTQAKYAQHFLLPQQMPQKSNVRIASKFVPMAEIGGDFFDVIEIEQNKYGVLVGDVTGHGITAALLSFMSAISFKNTAPKFLSTREVIQVVNDMLLGKMHDYNFVALFYAIYDADSGELTYTQAGTPPGLLVHTDTKKVIPLETRSSLIGLFPELEASEKRVTLSPGDRIILYTDAITEIANSDGTLFGVDGLKSLIVEHSELTIENLVEKIYTAGLAYSGQSHYQDDFTLVGMEITP